MFHQAKTQPLCIIAMAFLLAVLAGCQSSVPTMNWNPFKSAESKSEFQQPVRVAVIWKETAVSPPGKKSTRGFGGRVYFYNQDDEAIRVDGELTVYAFDDSGSNGEESRVPERKYVFRTADLQRHYGKSALGDSYNIWLPWDKVGGERKTISLIPVFKPTNGMMPQADQSIAVLSGTTTKTEEQFSKESGFTNSRINQVSMTVPAGAPNNMASRVGVSMERINSRQPVTSQSNANTVRTTTFDIPRATANRMKLTNTSRSRRHFVNDKQYTTINSPISRTELVETNPIQVTEPASNRRRSTKVFGAPGSFR